MSALKECRDQVFADYRRKTPKSAAMFERACRSMPGGVSGNLRYYSPYPVYTASASGSRVRDLDGNDYIDCFSCNGPLMLGHRHPAIARAANALNDTGSLVLNPTVMVECAEAICDVLPCAEQVRFLNSGTEAVMSAVRYARAFTGKDKVIKFFGHYHGQDDQFLLGVTPDRTQFGNGIPQSAQTATLTLPFGDASKLEELLSSRDDIACVLLDPAMHSGGLWGATSEYLRSVRELTSRNNVILIFDEVITGFRVGLGGAQGMHDVIPDLTTLGKALSCGEKLGAVAGSARVMSVTDPLAPADAPHVFQSGTGNDGTLALACAAAAIDQYRKLSAAGEYARLAKDVEALKVSLLEIFGEAGVALHVNSLASMMQLYLTDEEPSFERYAHLSSELLELLYLALINEGVMLSLPTSNHVYFSFSHSKDDFAQIENAARIVLRKYPFAAAAAELKNRR
jgi:glutamate-1-semialdehyde 2,1-aminomutase